MNSFLPVPPTYYMLSPWPCYLTGPDLSWIFVSMGEGQMDLVSVVDMLQEACKC